MVVYEEDSLMDVYSHQSNNYSDEDKKCLKVDAILRSEDGSLITKY